MRGWGLPALGSGLGVAGLAGLLLSAQPERVVGRFSTTLEGRLLDQRHNAELALRRLDGLRVPAGGVLSFNEAVGSWSRDQGYRRAPVSFGGTLISTWGGGVCQTSTTLYNAALMGGFEVVERHPHHFVANYVPPGRDAAVAYPNLDLKVRNPYRFPIRVRARVVGEAMVVELWGAGEGRSIQIAQNVVHRRSPAEFVVGTGPSQRVRNPGKPGYEVETYRLADGVRELVSVDSYPVMNRVVERR